MKKLAIAVVTILVLLIAGLLILPSFWDWNGEKTRIAREVYKHTGRDIDIVGDVNLQLIPAPALSARQVSLAGIEGGSAAKMIDLEELRVKVALFPLLQGQVVVETVTLVKPTVFLEVLSDGRRNWDFDAPAATQASAPQQRSQGDGPAPDESPDTRPGATVGDGTGDAIRVDSFIIEDGTLTYRDAVNDVDEQVTELNAELAADSLLGPFVANGSAVYQGVEGAFDVSLDRLRDKGATGFSLALQLPQASASMNLSGALSQHEDLQTLRGRLRGEGGDLSAVLRLLLDSDNAALRHSVLAQPFAIASELSGSSSEAEAAAVKLSLGSLDLEGDAKVLLGDLPEVTVNLSASRLDVDSLLPSSASVGGGQAVTRTPESSTAEPSPAPGDPPAQPADLDPGDAGFALPGDIAAKLALSVDTLVYRGQFARNLQAEASLRDGKLAVERLTAGLPGGSDVALSGSLASTDKGEPAFKGRVEAASDNLRALADWFNVDLAAVPADRLRKMSLKTVVDATPQQVTLQDIDLRLDVSQITGGVAVALRERTGLGIGLAVDRVNLDAYLPAERTSGEPQSPGRGAGAGDQPPAGAGPDPSEANAADGEGVTAEPPALVVLNDFDANFDIKVGALTYQGLAFNGLRLDATLQQGGLVVREASLMDLAGSSARYSGSVANVARDPALDGSLDVSVASLSRLIKALELPPQGQLPLESFTLSGSVNGNRQQLRFDQRLAALGGDLRATGTADLSQALPQVDAAVEVTHPNLTLLLSELIPGEEVPGSLGAVDLKARLAAAPQTLRMTALSGKAAGVEIAGDLALEFAGPRPKVTAKLQTDALPLAALGAPAAGASAGGKKAKTGAKKPQGGATGSKTAATGKRWSSAPIDLSALRDFDADITVESAALLLDKTRLDMARIEADLNDGLLDLKRFSANTYGGALSVSGKADVRETAPGGLEVAAAVTVIDLDLKELLRDMADTDRFSGPISLESSLNARGNSEAALIGSLNGQGRIDGTVTVKAKAEEQAGALVLGILGTKVKEIRGISDSAALLFSAFAGAASKIDGTFVVEQGVVTTTNTKVRGRSAEALTAGTVNLPTWQLNSQTDVFRDSDPQQAYLTAKLRGSLDGPDVKISGQPFQRRPEPAPSTTTGPKVTPLSPEAGPDAAAEEKKKPKPEDLLKDGLRGILKGLGG